MDNTDTLYLGGPALPTDSVGFLYWLLSHAVYLLWIFKFIVIVKFLKIVKFINHYFGLWKMFRMSPSVCCGYDKYFVSWGPDLSTDSVGFFDKAPELCN